MKSATKFAQNAAKMAFEPLETLHSQVAKPILDEAAKEIGSFFGAPRTIGKYPKSIAQEELKRARDQQKIEEMQEKDEKASREDAQRVFASIKQEYRLYEAQVNRSQESTKQEFRELQEEIAKLAKSAGVETKAHLENTPKKIGVLDIKRLTTIIRFLRIKADESKSAKEIVAQRQNAKPATGMLAWVSGKQMKVHEQGTLQLQG